MTNLVAKKGVKFSIEHTDGHIAKETISHITNDGLVVCESCAVYTLEEAGLELEKNIHPVVLKKLKATVGYMYNERYESFYGVDKMGAPTGLYDINLLKENNKPFLA